MNNQLSYLESVEVHKEIVRYYRKEALLEAILNAICFCIIDGICCLLAGKLALLCNTVIAGIIIFAIMLIVMQCITSCTISKEEKLIDTSDIKVVTISDRYIDQDSNHKSIYKVVCLCNGVAETYEVREWQYESCKIGTIVRFFVK